VLRALALVLLAAGPAWGGGVLDVVTTSTDLKALVEAVGGERVTAESLAPALHEPHAVDVKPGQLARLKSAALLVRVGLDHEPWLARVRALLRRSSITDGDSALTVGDLVLDPMRRQAWRGERELDLTKTEFDLLELLMFNAGIVVTRESIYERIWGYDFETSSKSLDVYISYLRRKTEEAGEARLIHTVRGVGYTARQP